jgi:putative sigma-54 modulation protein
MELRIQSVNFDASEQLKAFVERKVTKLGRFSDNIVQAEVILKVVKPDAAKNKEASIKMNLKQGEAFASKTADTFEEAVDLCTAAIEKQIMKTKEKGEK